LLSAQLEYSVGHAKGLGWGLLLVRRVG